MEVLSIQATQNNLSEAGKAILFGMQWEHWFNLYINAEERGEKCRRLTW